MKYSHLPLWLSTGKINCVASIFSIVALQCRVSFHYTAKGISAMFTRISSFFNFLPTQLTTEHWVELPVLHSRFTNYLFHKCYKQCIHANVNPPINPTYSFPPWYLYICSLHLCLYFLFADKIIYTTFLDFTYNVLIRYFSLTSVCMTVSRYIHVSASGTISLLLWLIFHCIFTPHLYPFLCSSHQAAKVLELQLQHESFQWIFRVDFL